MRSRSYCFTINNYSDDDLVDLILLCDHAEYMICGFEEGEKGTPHLQGYVYFNNAHILKSVSKMIPRAYLVKAKGNSIQNFNYCAKDGNYYEYGTVPQQGKLRWDKMIEVYNKPTEYPHLYNQYRRSIHEIMQLEMKRNYFRTKFYVTSPVCDAITEIFNHFDWGETESVAVVNDLTQLERYNNPKRVIYFADEWEKEHDLWARGLPIGYKYGYEQRVIQPEILVIVTDTPKMYQLYKNII